MLVRPMSGVDFTNMFRCSLYSLRSQKWKNSVKLSVSFCAFGICARKALSKILVKLMLGLEHKKEEENCHFSVTIAHNETLEGYLLIFSKIPNFKWKKSGTQLNNKVSGVDRLNYPYLYNEIRAVLRTALG